ncbi:MoaD/ThiS family protein [Terriglobus albidus]|uniref:MoaD/ThiS family protein n=1 Tax=Terriglobus albidus TaxID=1592106 RepID=UPI0021E06A4F|nr:MoaD/ThiS family protein [Terriglobus albidus]
MVRVELPAHLCRLAGVGHEVTVAVDASPVTIAAVLEVLEHDYPALEGTIREHETKQRRAWLRFFVCEEDWSHIGMDAVLPPAIVSGKQPLLVIGAIAGG